MISRGTKRKLSGRHSAGFPSALLWKQHICIELFSSTGLLGGFSWSVFHLFIKPQRKTSDQNQPYSSEIARPYAEGFLHKSTELSWRSLNQWLGGECRCLPFCLCPMDVQDKVVSPLLDFCPLLPLVHHHQAQWDPSFCWVHIQPGLNSISFSPQQSSELASEPKYLLYFFPIQKN